MRSRLTEDHRLQDIPVLKIKAIYAKNVNLLYYKLLCLLRKESPDTGIDLIKHLKLFRKVEKYFRKKKNLPEHVKKHKYDSVYLYY